MSSALDQFGRSLVTASRALDRSAQTRQPQAVSQTGHSPGRRRRRNAFRPRRVLLSFAALAVVSGGAAVAVATVLDPRSTVQAASPAQLFADNPADWNQDNLPNSNTPVVASSVKEMATINVPGVGTFQYWGAQTTDGEWCAAFRAPDGTWAGTHNESPAFQPNYSFGGDVPGCGVWPPNDPGGFDMQGGGFHFTTDTISPLPDAQNTTSWIYYGIIDNPGAATTVVDATSGASTPILAGGTFALVLPQNSAEHVRLEAVDGSGNVISQAYPAGWNDPVVPAQKAYRAELTNAAQIAPRSPSTRNALIRAWMKKANLH